MMEIAMTQPATPREFVKQLPLSEPVPHVSPFVQQYPLPQLYVFEPQAELEEVVELEAGAVGDGALVAVGRFKQVDQENDLNSLEYLQEARPVRVCEHEMEFWSMMLRADDSKGAVEGQLAP
jgi:hypothetical protein